MTYTLELNGLAMGEGTDYRLKTFPDGFGTPSYVASRLQRQGVDGTRPLGRDVLASRFLNFEVQMVGTDASNESLWQALNAAWAPVRTGTVALEFTGPGTDYTVFGRPTGVTLAQDFTKYGKTLARCGFEATDPRLFSQSSESIVLGLTGEGGFTFDLTFPLVFGTAGDNDGVAVNAGTFETTWSASIAGPVNTPTITLAATGEQIELDGDIPTGSTLTLDQSTQSVQLNGSPRQTWVTLPSRWFTLAVGSNTIRYRAASGTGDLTFTWRSAWL